VIVDYLRYIADKFALGGLFITRTVDEWLWTGEDEFLNTIKHTNPLAGGDPSIDPAAIRYG